MPPRNAGPRRPAPRRDPGAMAADVERAAALHRAGDRQGAARLCQAILAADRENAAALHLLGLIVRELGDPRRGLALLAEAVRIAPGNAGFLNSLGLAYARQSRVAEAAEAWRRVIAIEPSHAEALTNLGNALVGLGRHSDALDCYRRAVAADPAYAPAQLSFGSVLLGQGRPDAAIACLRRALEIEPGNELTAVRLFHAHQHACDWQGLARLAEMVDAQTRAALAAGRRPAETAFINVARCDDAAVNLAVAAAWSREAVQDMARHRLAFVFEGRRVAKPRLTIGYLSSDFHDHPTAHLAAAMFALHDRDAFVVHAYSHGPADDGVYRRRIVAGCDRFVDIAGESHAAAAQRIHADGVDILVDLKGQTGGARQQIAAVRPCPVQATYLGFPGTSGADFFDYVITDAIVSPAEDAAFYSERLACLSPCYQVNDGTQPIAGRPATRGVAGLPEDAFVFCSYNQPFKIDPAMFDVWMRLLRAVPDSVLWLWRRYPVIEANLRAEAKARGVDPDRLVFTGKLPKDQHLARLRLADLALDTRLYNGHTSTSDALWAGLPVVALRGRHFASRVSASLLAAIGLPELIADDLAGYERLATSLAQDRAALSALRRRLEAARGARPLFDTQHCVRGLERLYRQMWDIFVAGEAPRPIAAGSAAPAISA